MPKKVIVGLSVLFLAIVVLATVVGEINFSVIIIPIIFLLPGVLWIYSVVILNRRKKSYALKFCSGILFSLLIGLIYFGISTSRDVGQMVVGFFIMGFGVSSCLSGVSFGISSYLFFKRPGSLRTEIVFLCGVLISALALFIPNPFYATFGILEYFQFVGMMVMGFSVSRVLGICLGWSYCKARMLIIWLYEKIKSIFVKK